MIYKYTIIKLKYLVCTKLGETYREFIIVVSTTAYIHCYDRFNGVKVVLTHWGRVTHICVSKLTIIGSDNGLSPDRRQAIIWTNAGILLIEPLGTNFSEILIEILTFSFKKKAFESVVCETAAILSRPQWVKRAMDNKRYGINIFKEKHSRYIISRNQILEGFKTFCYLSGVFLHQLGSYGEVIL